MRAAHLFVTILLPLPFAAMGAPPASHCAANEDVLFTCRTGGKVLSFCAASTNGRAAPAWIQYRFGKIGKAELVYPAERTTPAGHFKYSTEHGGRWVTSAVQFSNNGFSYVLSAYGNGNIPESNASLLIVRPDGSRKVLQCDDPGLYAAAGLAPFEQFRLTEVPQALRK